MIKRIYRAIMMFFHNLFSKPTITVLPFPIKPPRYGRIKMNQTSGKRYRHTDPRRVA